MKAISQGIQKFEGHAQFQEDSEERHTRSLVSIITIIILILPSKLTICHANGDFRQIENKSKTHTSNSRSRGVWLPRSPAEASAVLVLRTQRRTDVALVEGRVKAPCPIRGNPGDPCRFPGGRLWSEDVPTKVGAEIGGTEFPRIFRCTDRTVGGRFRNSNVFSTGKKAEFGEPARGLGALRWSGMHACGWWSVLVGLCRNCGQLGVGQSFYDEFKQ